MQSTPMDLMARRSRVSGTPPASDPSRLMVTVPAVPAEPTVNDTVFAPGWKYIEDYKPGYAGPRPAYVQRIVDPILFVIPEAIKDQAPRLFLVQCNDAIEDLAAAVSDPQAANIWCKQEAVTLLRLGMKKATQAGDLRTMAQRGCVNRLDFT